MGKCDFLLTYVLGKCCLLLTVNIAFLVLGIYVGNGASQRNGVVVLFETQEWSKPPILDIKSVNITNNCPEGYKIVTGIFFGTKDYCKLQTSYKLGSCGKKEGIETVNGMRPTTFEKFDGQQVCKKLDETMDYH